MQRCLEKGLRKQKMALSTVIVSQIAGLIEDQYGNYLIQNVLRIQDELLNGKIY